MDLSAADLVAVVVMLVVLAIPIMIAFPIVIPFMAMLEAAAIAVPVAVVEEAAFEAGTNPAPPGIRSTSPITFMPAVMSVGGIPVAFDPEKIGTRGRRRGNYHPGRRWWTDSDAYSDLGVCSVGAEQQNPGKQRKAQQVFHAGSPVRRLNRRGVVNARVIRKWNSDPHRPRVMRSCLQRQRRSVDRGTCGPYPLRRIGSSPKARAGCGNPACPDPWRGL